MIICLANRAAVFPAWRCMLCHVHDRSTCCYICRLVACQQHHVVFDLGFSLDMFSMTANIKICLWFRKIPGLKQGTCNLTASSTHKLAHEPSCAPVSDQAKRTMSCNQCKCFVRSWAGTWSCVEPSQAYNMIKGKKMLCMPRVASLTWACLHGCQPGCITFGPGEPGWKSPNVHSMSFAWA